MRLIRPNLAKWIYEKGPPVGVAVSGGSDSVALLLRAADRAASCGVTLRAASVDHRLRAGSDAEARDVAALCDRLGVAHDTLVWDPGWDGTGNLQAKARAARYGLLAGWARGHGLSAVLLGHTRDDDAEGFLMALAREAGLDGLSGMRAEFEQDGMRFGRPLLDLGRAELQAELRRKGTGWASDPSNDDPRFERVRARKALADLAPLGITAEGLHRTIGHLAAVKAQYRDVLDAFALLHVTQLAGGLIVDWGAFKVQPGEVQRKLMIAFVRWISGDPSPPRAEKIGRLLSVAESRGGAGQLRGCHVETCVPDADILMPGDRPSHVPVILIRREDAKLPRDGACPDGLWDGRWTIEGPWAPPVRVVPFADVPPEAVPERVRAARDDILAVCTAKWGTAPEVFIRRLLETSPAIMDGEVCLAVPAIHDEGRVTSRQHFAQGRWQEYTEVDETRWSARIVADFRQTLLSH